MAGGALNRARTGTETQMLQLTDTEMLRSVVAAFLAGFLFCIMLLILLRAFLVLMIFGSGLLPSQAVPDQRFRGVRSPCRSLQFAMRLVPHFRQFAICCVLTEQRSFSGDRASRGHIAPGAGAPIPLSCMHYLTASLYVAHTLGKLCLPHVIQSLRAFRRARTPSLQSEVRS